MSKKTLRKKQKMYNMKGCSKTRKKLNLPKKHLGGSPDAPLAYTGKPTFSIPNPNLAYTGKGGSSCGLSIPSMPASNQNAENPAYPNSGPPYKQGGNIFNNAGQQGGCGCGMVGGKKNKKGGNCGPGCTMGFMVGGVRHRHGCKCSKCKKRIMKGGNPGIPYPNGLTGSSFTPANISGWPGVDGVGGNRNHFQYNTYGGDVSRQMISNPPIVGGKKKTRKQKGGSLSNFMAQDLINLGRQFQYGIGSAYNALAGYSSPINPLPWKDQFPNTPSLNTSTI